MDHEIEYEEITPIENIENLEAVIEAILFTMSYNFV